MTFTWGDSAKSAGKNWLSAWYTSQLWLQHLLVSKALAWTLESSFNLKCWRPTHGRRLAAANGQVRRTLELDE